jgi:hypothetical protein
MMLIRMRAHPLPEARSYADLMLTELRKVIPSFLKRVDIADRGGRWTRYFEDNHQATTSLVDSLLGAEQPNPTDLGVTLTDWDPEAEDKLLAAICYPHSHLSETQLMYKVANLGTDQRMALIAAWKWVRASSVWPARSRRRCACRRS